MEETIDTKRAFIIANFCDDENDIERLLGPIEEAPSKFADGTIKTKPILREYAIALVERNNITLEKKVDEQQKQIAKLEKQLVEQQKQINKQQYQIDKLIHLFVDDEDKLESDSESDSESESESDSESE
jgi:uncharacterized coiled-coil protein SlyX